MNISVKLLKQIKATYMVAGSETINTIGGSFKAIDIKGNWFVVEWFHGKNPCYGDISHAWIGRSETNQVVT